NDNVETHRKNEPPGKNGEIPGRRGGESDSTARKETATPRPLQEPPRSTSDVTTGKEATGEGTCVGVTVARGDGSPGQGFLLTLLDETSGKSYQTKTGPKGIGRFCGLVPGRQVAIKLQGPKGKPLATRQLVLKAGLNPIEFQGQEAASKKE